jgi:ABC-2 type transport system permease protein
VSTSAPPPAPQPSHQGPHQPSHQPPSAPGPGSTVRPRRSAWAASPRGIALMAGLELRQKVRSVRWYVALAVWFVVLTGTSGLVLGAFWLNTQAFGDLTGVSRVVYSLIVLFLVFAMMLVLPALSAGAINGERSTGTLAVLQVSLLTPTEIALGKLAAGWITGLAFIAAALPALLPTALIGQISPLYVLRVLVMIAALALCITAVGIGLSSLASRQLGSVVLAYLVVLGATFVLPIIWGTSSVMLVQQRGVTVYEQSYDAENDQVGECVARQQDRRVVRSDIPLVLMWPNPMVLVADMAPTLDPDAASDDPASFDLLGLISLGIRYAADPTHPSNFNECYDEEAPGYPTDLGSPQDRPVWPMGLGMWVLAGAGGVAFTVRRLATPQRRIGRGERIA